MILTILVFHLIISLTIDGRPTGGRSGCKHLSSDRRNYCCQYPIYPVSSDPCCQCPGQNNCDCCGTPMIEVPQIDLPILPNNGVPCPTGKPATTPKKTSKKKTPTTPITEKPVTKPLPTTTVGVPTNPRPDKTTPTGNPTTEKTTDASTEEPITLKTTVSPIDETSTNVPTTTPDVTPASTTEATSTGATTDTTDAGSGIDITTVPPTTLA